MERDYKPNKLGRAFAARITDEDYEILYFRGAGVRSFYGKADRADAEIMFARCDSAPKKESAADRRSRCGDRPL